MNKKVFYLVKILIALATCSLRAQLQKAPAQFLNRESSPLLITTIESYGDKGMPPRPRYYTISLGFKVVSKDNFLEKELDTNNFSDLIWLNLEGCKAPVIKTKTILKNLNKLLKEKYAAFEKIDDLYGVDDKGNRTQSLLTGKSIHPRDFLENNLLWQAAIILRSPKPLKKKYVQFNSNVKSRGFYYPTR